RFVARERAVDELIYDNEIAGVKVFFKRTHRADRQYLRYTSAFHGVDVRAEINLRRRYAVAAAVSRQENELLAHIGAKQELIGWRAKRRFNFHPTAVFQFGDVVDAASTDNSQQWFAIWHKYKFPAFVVLRNRTDSRCTVREIHRLTIAAKWRILVTGTTLWNSCARLTTASKTCTDTHLRRTMRATARCGCTTWTKARLAAKSCS